MRIINIKLASYLLALVMGVMALGSLVSADETEPNQPLQEFTHTVFAEELTATWCQHCPYVAEALNNIYTSHDYPYYFIALITDVNDKAADRASNDYNLPGYPTVVFDGGYVTEVGSTDNVSEDEARFRPDIESCGEREVPELEIDLNAFDLGSASLDISVNVTNLEMDSYSGHVRVYITEKVSRYLNYHGNPYHYGFLDYAFDEEINIEAESSWQSEVVWNGSEHQDTLGNDFGDIDSNNIFIVAAIFNNDPHVGSYPPYPNVFVAYYVDQAIGKGVIPAPVYGVEITPPTQGQVISAGQSVVYNFNIKNIGDSDDTFTLTKSGVHSDWGTLSHTSIPLTPGSEQEITLEVNVPGGTPEGYYEIEVKATSNGDPVKFSTAITNTSVSFVVTYGVDLLSSLSSRTANPGQTVTYTITVKNTGNTDDTISLTKSGADSGWGSLSKTSVFLSSGSSEDITLMVNIPGDASEGDHPINVKGTSQGDPGIYSEKTFTTTVEAIVYGVDLDPNFQEDTVEVGDSLDFIIKLTNTGNTEVWIDLTIDSAQEEWTELSYYEVNLGPGMYQDLAFTVDVPAAAEASDYDFKVKAVVDGNPSIFDEVTVRVTVTEPSIISITEIMHSPSNPTEDDEITITAKVVGNNINSVSMEYCQGEICFPPESMQHMGSDEYSVTFGPLSEGDYEYEVKVVDINGKPFKSDKYPLTVSQEGTNQEDTDGDGYNDDIDAFPTDPTQWLDTDGDGYGDNPDGNNPDAYPNDPNRWSSSVESGAEWYESENARYMIMLLIIVIVVCAILAGLFARPKKKGQEIATAQVIPEPAIMPLAEPMAEPVFTPYTMPQFEEISCPKCYTVFNVPTEVRPMEVQCPSCGMRGILD